MSKQTNRAAALVVSMNSGNTQSRCNALRDVCPCRNNQRDLGVWREVFRKAVEGSMNERNQAAHAIGTLLQKAPRSAQWRDVVHRLERDLDAVMADERASRLVLGQMKRHGHAHRGAAAQSYRRHRKAVEIRTPDELAKWANDRLSLRGSRRVTGNHPGVHRLWRWMSHRIKFQPNRKTRDREIVEKAEHFLLAG